MRKSQYEVEGRDGGVELEGTSNGQAKSKKRKCFIKSCLLVQIFFFTQFGRGPLLSAMAAAMFIFKIAFVNFVGGMIFGYNVGMVPIYLNYNDVSTNCTKMTAENSCNSLSFVTCDWTVHNSSSECLFPDVVHCTTLTHDECKKYDFCYFDHSCGECLHNVGWDPTKTGVFAGAMIVGAMFGSFLCGPLMTKVGRCRALLIAGVIGTIGSILVSVGRASNVFALIIIARLIVGVTCGMATVVSPAYVNEMAPEALKTRLGCVFQIAVTFGIVFAAAFGYALAPNSYDHPLHMETRYHFFLNISTLVSLLCVVAALWVPESTKWLELATGGEKDDIQMPLVDTTEHTWSSMWFQLIVAVVLSAAMQLTGINAIMNYAPKITKAAGFPPLLGNFIVMLWNFVTTLASIPISKKFSFRQMYLIATFVASIACLFCGIPVLPGVLNDETVKHIMVGIGILLFIAAFEIGMGPPFYVLAQEVFPRTFRSKGASFTLATQFIFNIVINVCFPICQQAFSGGPDGNQDKGLAILFMFFGGTGLAAAVFLTKFLRPVDEQGYSEIS